MTFLRYVSIVYMLAATAFLASAQFEVEYEGGVTANYGKGDIAPYYINSNRGGTLTQQYSILLNAAAKHELDTTSRFSFGFGAEFWGGHTSSVSYDRYDLATDKFVRNLQHPARAWVQQLYADVKYRSLFATVGAKARQSDLASADLSIGDLVMSGNARPGTGVRAGFVNYQNIPYTNGWVQISGEIGYERLADGDWLENHYNYYNNFLTTGYWFNYKKLRLRTRPDQPFVFTIGAQAACQFAGTQNIYENGILTKTVKMHANFKSFFHSIIAGSGGENSGDQVYVEGNHVGSWDIMLDYQHDDLGKFRAYHQTIWEDGSGIGLQNGFDGLWGLEWCSATKSFVSGVVLEYIDFTNQSGHIHFAEDLNKDSAIEGGATGSDDYYNNYSYNGYQNRGMSIGSPFVKSPIYNTDGYMRYLDNLVRGFHIGMKGYLSSEYDYRLLFSTRKAYGTPEHPRARSVRATCFMLEANAHPSWLRGLELKAQFAFDRGSLLGNNTGGMVSVSYHGDFNIGK